jgi:hypothetical protein
MDDKGDSVYTIPGFVFLSREDAMAADDMAADDMVLYEFDGVEAVRLPIFFSSALSTHKPSRKMNKSNFDAAISYFQAQDEDFLHTSAAKESDFQLVIDMAATVGALWHEHGLYWKEGIYLKPVVLTKVIDLLKIAVCVAQSFRRCIILVN